MNTRFLFTLASIMLAACSTTQAQVPVATPQPLAPIVSQVTTIEVISGGTFCYENPVSSLRREFSITKTNDDIDLTVNTGGPLAIKQDPSFFDGNHLMVVETNTIPDDLTLFWIEITDEGNFKVSDSMPTLTVGSCKAK